MSKSENKGRKINLKKLWKYALVFFIPVICMLIHMWMKECHPFGNNTILIGDANKQYYAFFIKLSEKIKSGGSLFFSWDGGMGYDFYSNFLYYLASPFNIIAMLFGGEHMELGMAVTMLVQTGMCGVSMCWYLSHTTKNRLQHGVINDLLCAVFSLAYAMCDFILAYQYNMMWLISLILAPFVMLGIEHMNEKNDVRLYFAALFFAFITNYYFSWFICLLAIVWFIDQKKSGIKDFFRKFVKIAATSIVAALSASVVLVPCFLAVISREDKWTEINDFSIATFGKIGNIIQSFFWGHGIDTNGSNIFTNNNYCGVFTVVLCLCFLFNKNIHIRQRFKRMAEILLGILAMNWVVMSYIFHGFTIAHLVFNRYGFIVILLIIVTAFEHINSYPSISYRSICYVAILSVIGIAVVFLKNNKVQSMMCYLISIMIILYIVMIFFFERKKSIKQISLIVNLIVIGFVEIISNYFMVNKGIFSVSKEYIASTYEWADAYNNIETNELERKTAWVFSQNNMAYSDTNIFASSINSNLLWLFEKLGFIYQTNGGSYAYRGTTPVTAMMFNVRYVLADSPAYFGGYAVVSDLYQIHSDVYNLDVNYGIYENEYINGLGYAVPDDIIDWDISSNSPFVVQNDYINKISGIDDVFTHVDIKELKYFSATNNGCKIFPNMIYQIDKKSDNVYLYQNFSIDESIYASVTYKFTVPRDMYLYAYVKDTSQVLCSLSVDGVPIILDSTYPAPQEVLDLGELKAGSEVEIAAYNNSALLQKGMTIIDFYEYHDDRMQECMDILKNGRLTIEEYDDTYVRGRVNVTEDKLLYTSIPYYRGFTAYVDGEKTDIVGIGNNALIGLKLSEGEHIIELKYVPYGFWLGLALSCLGLCIVSIYIVAKRRKGQVA